MLRVLFEEIEKVWVEKEDNEFVDVEINKKEENVLFKHRD